MSPPAQISLARVPEISSGAAVERANAGTEVLKLAHGQSLPVAALWGEGGRTGHILAGDPATHSSQGPPR